MCAKQDLNIVFQVVFGEHGTHIVKHVLSLSHLCNLGHFLNALNSFFFQVLSELAAHGRISVSLRLATGRDEAHLARLFVQVLVFCLQCLKLARHSLRESDPLALLRLDLVTKATELLASLHVLELA